jgi:hypothetical protein
VSNDGGASQRVVLPLSLMLAVLSATIPMGMSWLVVGSASLALGVAVGTLMGVPSVVAVGVAARTRDLPVLPAYLGVLAFSCLLAFFVPFIFTFVAVTAASIGAITVCVVRRFQRVS